MKKIILLYMAIIFCFSFIQSVHAQTVLPPVTSEIEIPPPDGGVPVIPDSEPILNPDSEVPVIPDSEPILNPDSEVPVIPDSEPILNPDGEVPVIPDSEPILNPDGNLPLNPDGNLPLNPDGNLPLNPDGSLPLNPDGNLPLNPDGNLPLNPDGNLPLNPDGSLPLNPDGELNRPEELITIRIEPGTGLKDLKMISFPLQMENIDSKVVFPQINEADYENDFRIGTYDPIKGGYNEFGSNLKINQGRSLWILARNGIDISVQETQASTIDDFDLQLFYNSTTGDGWNMIACPNDKSYDWSNGIQVFQKDDDGNIISGPASITSSENNLVDVKLWKWDNGTYIFYDPAGTYENQLYDSDPDINANLLKPNQGYWAKALMENVWIRFPGSAVASQEYQVESEFSPIVNKTKTWINKYLFSASKAIADSNDGPPAPIGNISGTTGADGTAGCFIKSAGCN